VENNVTRNVHINEDRREETNLRKSCEMIEVYRECEGLRIVKN
jgi:hypothetical protein